MATVTEDEPSRRDLLAIATGAVGVAGLVAAVYPLVAQLEPDASTLATSTTEVDLAPIAEGQIADGHSGRASRCSCAIARRARSTTRAPRR